MADEETRAAAAAVLGEPEFVCADCGTPFRTKAGLAQHRRHTHAASARTAPPTQPADALVAEVIGKTVANLQVMGGYLAVVLPHTGVALMGVPHPESTEARPLPDVVQSRAAMAGNVLAKLARRDERVLAALNRFNQLFETSEVVELAAGLGAAVAVDVGAVPADLAIEVGPFTGTGAIQPVRAIIGDVVDYVAAARAQAEAQQPPRAPDGVAADGATVVSGGVEDT
ncbi:MAG TPA: C2H2-type zinc finger protein [Myxococcales bacterium]|nr:C2H2-type zinc finger protein [Myxococcales bacterium]